MLEVGGEGFGVETVFALPLDQLLQQNEVQQTDRGMMPVYRGGPAPVWGLTAFILKRFLLSLEPHLHHASKPHL